ncbi:MAG: LD-carboxypeptidase [Eubacterium sp.]|nr:LD-carboxypeptidase [Eubacterium sp.]
MKYPEFLKKHDIIGYVAPSFGCAIEPYRTAFMRARSVIKKKQQGEQLGPNCFADDGIGISTTPEKCADEFVKMYCNVSNQALISCGGGELMCEILPYIDFEALYNAEPKWFMGYSDNTNLTFILTTALDIASIYGPCISSFGMDPWHPSIHDAFDLLCGDERIVKTNDDGIKTVHIHNYDGWEIESAKDEKNPYAPYQISELFMPVCFNGREASGRLIGGCLDVLNNIAGTRFDMVGRFNKKYGSEGILWYLESCDLNVMDMRRALWHLKEAGWFECASGFLIGRPMHFDEPMFGTDRHSAVTDALKDINVPIIMDLDIGHLPPMMPLINGSFSHVSCKGRAFAIDMELRV